MVPPGGRTGVRPRAGEPWLHVRERSWGTTGSSESRPLVSSCGGPGRFVGARATRSSSVNSMLQNTTTARRETCRSLERSGRDLNRRVGRITVPYVNRLISLIGLLDLLKRRVPEGAAPLHRRSGGFCKRHRIGVVALLLARSWSPRAGPVFERGAVGGADSREAAAQRECPRVRAPMGQTESAL